MTEQKLVEKVAEAILASELWPGAWEKANEVERNAVLHKARAALSVIREALSEPSLQADVDRLRVALVRIEHECIIRQPATAVQTVKDVRAIARQALAAKWKALNVASPIGEK